MSAHWKFGPVFTCLLLRLKIELAAPIVAYPSLLACLTFAQWLLFLR